ncbi:MAG TPA: exonuclease SbcCD subunit D [Solirubrobacterales bacterium]|nr:exonuclease SbcCD subunit D [Solirubrobacterales bacterium]
MRVVHFADTHLGARRLHYTDERGRNVREQDIFMAFADAVDKILDLKPAVAVHAGDLFDGYHPSAAAMGVALDQLDRLRQAGIEVVVIAGNHSTPRSAAFEHPFAILERFGIHAVYGGPRRLRFGELTVTAVPHGGDEEVLHGWLAAAEPDASAKFNLLVAHLGLSGLSRVGTGEPGSLELSGEILEQSKGFDYVALGHLHEFDRIRVNAAYAGSLERLSSADRSKKKVFVEVDLSVAPTAEGFMQAHEIPVRAQLVLAPVDASATADLTELICASANASEIEGAIVRLPIRGVSFEAFGAVNRREVNAAFSQCLHLELDPEFVDRGAGESAAPRPQDLRDFLALRKPQGVDLDVFLGRAEAYMTRAAEELGS